MDQLKLKYIIELVSNLGTKAQEDARLVAVAQEKVQQAINKTSTELGKQETASTEVTHTVVDGAKAQTTAQTKVGEAVKATTQIIGRQDTVAEHAAKTGTEGAKVQAAAQTKLGEAVATSTGKFDAYRAAVIANSKDVAMLQDAITGATNKFTAMNRVMARVSSSSSMERQISYAQHLERAWTAAKAAAAGAAGVANRVADGVPVGVAGYMGGRTVAAPVLRAYSNLESANTDLKIALMQKGGKIPDAYGHIQGIAQDLGNRLPGTTKDYIESAIALASQGVNNDAIIGGGLKSAAYLGVLLKMDRGEAAETVAKIREAYGLHDDELPGLANDVQKNKFAFGLTPEGIRTAASYSGAALSALDIRGRENMSRILTLQGMANQAGMDPSSFGTNFAMMLTRLAQGPLLVEQAKKGMKGEARHIMERENISFDFFDKKGHLKQIGGDPIAGMVHELSKLEDVRKRLGEKTALELSAALFGQEAARPAMILAKAGDKGYAAALDRRDNQADLDERISLRLDTFSAKLEALGGTIENVQAKIGQQTGEGLKPVMDKANDVIGGPIDQFLGDHPAAGTAALGGGTALGAWLSMRTAGTAWKALAGMAGRGAAAAAATEGAAGAGAGAAGAAAGGAAMLTGAGLLGALASPLGLAAGALGLGAIGYSMRELYRANNREGVALSPYAQARIKAGALMQPGPSPMADVLNLTAPNQGTKAVPLGQPTEVKIGQGSMEIKVRVEDARVMATPVVLQQPNLISVSAGNTNPAGYSK